MFAVAGLVLCTVGGVAVGWGVAVGCAVDVGCSVAVGCSVGVVCAVAVGSGVVVAGAVADVVLLVICALVLINCDVGCTAAGAVLFSTTSILSQVTLSFT